MALPALPLHALERGVDPPLEEASSGILRLVKQITSFRVNMKSLILHGDVDPKLEDLKMYLRQIYFLLQGRSQLHGEKRSSLQAELREALYDLEDLVDEMEYYKIEVKLDEAGSKVSICNPLVRAFKLGKHLVSGIPCGESQFLKCLDSITSELPNLIALLEKSQGAPSDWPLAVADFGASNAGSVLLEDQQKVFGRNKELNDIVQMLTQTPPHRDQPSVLAVHGMGGMGKTTLARLVYNDARVEHHFDLRAWVVSGGSLDKMKVTEEILSSVNPSYLAPVDNKVQKFGAAQLQLKELLTGQRFLLVLDDLWDESFTVSSFQEILHPLRSAGRGSSILVTTRTKTVADKLAATRVYYLSALDTEDCWSLIKESALGGANTHGPTDALELIGRKVAARLNGLPLAAKLLAGLLKGTKSTKDWSSILDIEFCGDIIPSLLQLSYNFLPGELKQCFAYCSIFPKCYKFEKDCLVRLWMAHGFIQPQRSSGKRMEDLGTEYFTVLLSRSFFQAVKKGSKMQYSMHNLIHDMAVTIFSNDCYRNEQGLVHGIPSTVRHVSTTDRHLKKFGNLGKLRSLVLVRSVSTSLISVLQDEIGNMSSLRILDLSHSDLRELPEAIGDLKHLRYLNLSGKLQRLPEAVCKLYHLQSLQFTDKCSLDKLPDGTSMLVNLRHLDIDTRYLAEVSSIGQLVNLQGSLEFHVKKLKGHGLEELRSINSLHGQLKIKGLDNVARKEDACKARLNSKCNLRVLKLEWASASRMLGLYEDSEILENLQPHSSIKELIIERYLGAKSPSWLDLPFLKNLRSLRLSNCRNLELLPPLGLLPSLKLLQMKELCTVSRIGYEFYGTNEVAFPTLRVLVLEDFPSLLDWSEKVKSIPFPCLKKLKIVDCPKLAQIPAFPHSVTELTMERTRLISYLRLGPFSSSKLECLTLDIRTTNFLGMELFHQQHLESVVVLNMEASKQFLMAEGLHSFTSLQRLQLSHSNLTDQNLSSLLRSLPSLSSLEIRDLPNIVSLLVPAKISLCTTLTELKICSCPLLSSLASLDSLVSLKCLAIEKCPKLTAASFPKSFSTLKSLKVLSVSYCTELQSLPTSGLPTSLEALHLVGCHQKLTEVSRNNNGYFFGAPLLNLKLQVYHETLICGPSWQIE